MLAKLTSLLLLCLLSQMALADTRSNALALFKWAEEQYSALLTPTTGEVQEIQGFYVRYYPDSNIYVGVQGDDVWALGPQLGANAAYVGKIEDFISVTSTDISDAILTNNRGSCSYYADSLFSAVKDLQRGILFSGNVDISISGSDCIITTNSIPNHDFNDSRASFATQVAEGSAQLHNLQCR